MNAWFFARKRSVVRPEKVERLRTVRRKRRVVLIVICAVVIIILAGVFVWQTHNTRFAVQSVTVEGAHSVSSDMLQKFADSIIQDGRFHILGRNSIMLYPSHEVAQAILATYPRIQKADVHVDSWEQRSVRITVAERTVYAQWCASLHDETCFFIDNTGFVFEQAQKDDTLLTLYGNVVPHLNYSDVAPLWGTVEPEYFNALFSLTSELQDFSFIPQSITVEEHDAVVQLRNSFTIHADLRADALKTVNALVSVLDQKDLSQVPTNAIEYIDLRFGERIFYKIR